MARVTIEDCIKKISNPFDLVLYASQRSKELNQGEPTDLDKGNDKNTVIALREIGEGKIIIEELKNNSIAKLRKEPDQNFEKEEVEEVYNDDFEKQYKGEISKSGMAILPSKRMRKIPFNTSIVTEDKVSKEKEKPLELTEEVEEVEEKK